MFQNRFNKKLVFGTVLAMWAAASGALELKVQAPARAVSKPDLVVYYVNPAYLSGGSTIRVTVRNNGTAKSGSAVLLGQNTVYNGSYGEASIPALDPNHAVDLEVKFNRIPRKGNKIKFVADSKHHVSESNESNNVKYHNY